MCYTVSATCTCVYIHVHTWIHTGILTWPRTKNVSMYVYFKSEYCLQKPPQLYTHTRICVCMYTHILLNFSQLQLGRIGSLCLMHPSGPLGASEGKHLWFNFMTTSCCLGKVVRAAEADGRANQQVFYVWRAVRCSFIS